MARADGGPPAAGGGLGGGSGTWPAPRGAGLAPGRPGSWRYSQLAGEPPSSPEQRPGNGAEASDAARGRGEPRGAAASHGDGSGQAAAGGGHGGAAVGGNGGALGAASCEGEAELPRPIRRNGWLPPLAMLLAALFLQNTGLYLATRCYVRWMDELGQPFAQAAGAKLPFGTVVPGHDGAHGVLEGRQKQQEEERRQRRAQTEQLQAVLTLDDPLSELVRRVSFTTIERDPWQAEFWVDLLTSLVSAFWLGWVVRNHDLRLWTKVLVSAAVLAALKGFLAWATVLPDSAGWVGCQERLGEDGLEYWREAAAGGAGVTVVQAFQDILLLEFRSLWMMGRAGRQRVCADTVFSTPTCFCTLFSVSLYDAVRAPTGRLETTRRATLLGLAGLLLMLVLLADLALTVVSPHHYTLDVSVALALTVLVYGSPAVAVVAERWARCPKEAAAADASEAAAAAAEPGPGGLPAAPLRDLGQVTVPPCCVPFCSLGGLYYVRPQPGTLPRRPWNEESRKQHQRQVAEFAQIRERDAGRVHQVEEALDEEHARAVRQEGEARAAVDRRLAQRARELASAEERVIDEARQRLDGERASARRLEEKVVAETQRFSVAEETFQAQKAQLEGELQLAREAKKTAQDAHSQQEADARQRREEAEDLRALLARLRASLQGLKRGDGGVEKPPAEAEQPTDSGVEKPPSEAEQPTDS